MDIRYKFAAVKQRADQERCKEIRSLTPENRREIFEFAMKRSQEMMDGIEDGVKREKPPVVSGSCELTDDDRWKEYLSNLQKYISERHDDSVRTILKLLESEVPCIVLPIASPGGELSFRLLWNTDRYYFDIDIAEDGTFDWWCRDRESKKLRGGDGEMSDDVTKQLFDCLKEISNEKR